MVGILLKYVLFLLTELVKFEIQKCGQILCAHKPYIFMPGHIFHYIQPLISSQKFYCYACKHAPYNSNIILTKFVSILCWHNRLRPTFTESFA